MTSEEEQNLIKRVRDLEDLIKTLVKKSIQVNMDPTDKENIKNALFEGFVQPDKETTKDANISYLKVIWKNRTINIPYYV
jgi:hypothetical protein